MPTTDSELTMSLGGKQPGKEDTSPPCREGGGIGDSLLSCMPHHTDGMAGDSQMSSMKLPYSKKWEEQPLSELLVWATDQHQEAPMLANDILNNCHSAANPNGLVPIGKYGSHIGTWKQKANTVTDTNT